MNNTRPEPRGQVKILFDPKEECVNSSKKVQQIKSALETNLMFQNCKVIFCLVTIICYIPPQSKVSSQGNVGRVDVTRPDNVPSKINDFYLSSLRGKYQHKG